LWIVNQRRSLGLVNDLAGLDDVDAVGDGERAIEILLDQQDRKNGGSRSSPSFISRMCST
jgi:hypothetical protein